MSRQKKQEAGGRSRRQAAAKKPVSCSCLLLFHASILLFMLIAAGCRQNADNRGAPPNTLRAVPAARLAYTFTPDADAPPGAQGPEETKLKPIQDQFDASRKDDRLLRTVASPDRQRALALYETGETQEGEFRIDMYAADGRFLRNLTPPELSGAFAPNVSWSPDGKSIAFIGRKSLKQPTPPEMIPDVRAVPSPEGTPVPTPTVGPTFAPVPVFDTEQIYVCDRDGFGLRPLTTRNGLIYFYLAWSPDSHAITALACREDEWEARERASKLPAGRPRLIELDGRERLLDDELTEAGPVWSPDSSKIAEGFDVDVKIYDAVGDAPTQANIPLREPLLKASAAYDEKKLESKNKSDGGAGEKGGGKSATAPQTGATPVSFNPIVRLVWPEEQSLFIQTAYVRLYASEPVNTFQRWHKLSLSMQASQQKTASRDAKASTPTAICYSGPKRIFNHRSENPL